MSLSKKKLKQIEKTEGWKRWKQEADQTTDDLKSLNLSYDQLLTLAASLMVNNQEITKINSELLDELKNAELFLSASQENQRKTSDGLNVALAELLAEVGSVTAISFLKGIQTSKQINARKGARARLERDPKQAAKIKAKMLWQDWQTGKTIHKSGAAFARYVIAEFPVLETEVTVKRWIAEWQKEKSMQ